MAGNVGLVGAVCVLEEESVAFVGTCVVVEAETEEAECVSGDAVLEVLWTRQVRMC